MYLSLALPPGVWNDGTPYQAKGRFRDANLVRWTGATMLPVGPWALKTAGTVTGKARALITWRTNSGTTYAGIGTHSHLYVMSRSGTVSDITPAGFTSGRGDAVAGGGYGSGNYGAGLYGSPTTDTTTIQPASVWTLDTWGEDLVGCMSDDGKIYEWALNTAVVAARITNSPTANAIVVTEERFLFALGAANNPREVDWCDQAANTTWTPAATNQAGSFVLQSGGSIQCGKRVPGGALIFTDVDVWRASYLGPPLVYGFERIGNDCGVISRASAIVAGGVCYWMGLSSFWAYGGYVEPMPSDVGHHVFHGLNRQQASKVQAFHNSEFGEVWWLYPSEDSTEIDSYVFYNYRDKHWNVGSLDRTCAADRGIFQYPLMVNGSGAIYEHEVAFNAGDYSGSLPYAKTGPIELGPGDRTFMIKGMIPDELTAGQVSATFTTRIYPNGTATTSAAQLASNPIPLRITGRQVEVTYTGLDVSHWHLGSPRLDLAVMGLR